MNGCILSKIVWPLPSFVCFVMSCLSFGFVINQVKCYTHIVHVFYLMVSAGRIFFGGICLNHRLSSSGNTFVLPCPIPSHPFPSCPVMPCQVLFCRVLSRPVLPCLILPCLVSSRLVLYCVVLSSRVVFCLLFCLGHHTVEHLEVAVHN